VTLPEFTIIYTWGWIAVVSSISFISFLGYYFSESTLVKRISFYNVCTYFVILIIDVSRNFEKVITIMKPAAIILRKIEISKPQNGSLVVIMLHEGQNSVQETVDNWKKYS
jgi:hypothetical protein